VQFYRKRRNSASFGASFDLRHEPEWNPDTLGAQVEGPIGCGTVFHVVGRVMPMRITYTYT
jgi:hypothetical protein